MFSEFFIERPVLSSVIAFIVLLLGAVAIFQLPIAQYPPITPTTVQVTTSYPGASARTLIRTVALPIEQQVNGVENMIYMQSTSTNDGIYTLIVTFKVGTDPNLAQILVQNRVAAAMAQLPQSVQQQGVVTKKKSTAILQIVTLTSTKHEFDQLFLSNYATIQLESELERLQGVGDVKIFGVGEYSMRIWLDPELMRERSLTPGDVASAIQKQNVEVTSGQLGMPPAPAGQDFQLTVNIAGALSKAEEFEAVIVKSDAQGGGQITRIRDIGRVELGAQTYSQFFSYDQRPAAGVAIFQLPGSNALDTAARVEATMDKLSKNFPEGIEYAIPFDTTLFIRASVDEVYATLLQAGALVLLVIVIFLQDWRAILVPATTVPVTIIGAFAAMAGLGFSINLLTLFAVVLSIGIVVDDAIIVVEGTTQHLERGQNAKEAAGNAMRELFGPIVGITLVLMSVFLPAAFLPGITGQMYRQFALVIAATALISAINAVSLKPAQCARWLRTPDKEKKKNFIFRGFNAVYERGERAYIGLITRMVRRSGLMVCLVLVLVGVSVWGLTRIPTGFIPVEDQGYLMVSVQLPDAASLERTQRVMEKITAIGLKTPGVAHAITIGGVSALDNKASLANSGIIYLMLEDWKVRGKSEDLRAIYMHLSAALEAFEQASTLLLVPPPITGLGLSGGFQMQVELTGGSFDYTELQRVADAIVEEAKKQPEIAHVLTPFRANVPQLSLVVDRTQAETLNVSVGEVFDTLQSYLGSSYVNQFVRFGHTFMVFAQADSQFRLQPRDLKRLYVRSESGQMVPISAVVDIQPTLGPALITLYNLHPSATVNGRGARGYSSGQTIQVMEKIAASQLGPNMQFQWTAMSYQENLVGNSIYFTFALGMLLVYFVLAGQYESYLIPGAVILAVPLALLGTVAALSVTGLANNIYVQIGLVLLIALSAKNAILVVEMARARRAAGSSILDAAVEAARIRFRPILMTSFTFMLGVLPLVLASGAGAHARKSLGITAFSGMLASTCLAVLFVPSLYVVLQKWSERRSRR